MFKLKVSDKLVAHAEDQVKKHNFGKRYAGNGSPEEQTTGVIGQSRMMEEFGEKWVDGGAGCDNGIDHVYSGVTIDFKTMGRTTDPRPHFVNNFYVFQVGFKVDAVVFCSLNKESNILTVCGWCTKDELMRDGELFNPGDIRRRDDGTEFPVKHGMIEIRNEKLRPVYSMDDLRVQLEQHGRELRGEPSLVEAEEGYDGSWFNG